jgi:uncharacterized protein (TIGR02266 family)
MEAAERREFPRLEARLVVDLRTKYIYTTGSILNISSTGLFIMTQNPLPEGSELELTTHLPEMNKPTFFKGIVRWVRKTSDKVLPIGMGIELLSPNERKIKKIFKILRTLPKSI